MQQKNSEVNIDGPEQSVEQNDLEENKSSAKIDDGDGISAGYGVLQDVDNLLIIKNFKIAETHEKKITSIRMEEIYLNKSKKHKNGNFKSLSVKYLLKYELVHFGIFQKMNLKKN